MQRPWGWFRTVVQTPRFWIKIIRVRPGQRTSLQAHARRTELHLGLLHCRLIKPQAAHRMEPGWYVELAWGEPQETDIVRLADDYGRAGRS